MKTPQNLCLTAYERSNSHNCHELVREGWELLVKHLGLPRAIQFVVLLERGKGDSVAEIKEYWGEASIDEIHARITQWKEQRA